MFFLKDIVINWVELCMRSARALLGPKGACIYEFSCTDYAMHQLKTRTIVLAFFLIAWRVLRCNPLTLLIRSVVRLFRRVTYKGNS